MSLDPRQTGDGRASTETTDRSNPVIRPPIAWALAFVAGLAVDRLYPLRWIPATWPNVWLGVMVFGAGFALAIWAIVTFRRAGTRVESTEPTMAIVTQGPYRFTRNPIYLGMFLGQTGLAIGFDNPWILAMLIPFYLVLRYGVVAREEAYLERKFGYVYSDYESRVRRWL
jgi:protein-S-isoprenylcysteine O-methyltransferase Ste14